MGTTRQISQLNPKPSPVAGTDQFGIDDNTGVSYKVTMANIQVYVNSHLPTAIQSIAALSMGADEFIYTSAPNTFTNAPFTSVARQMVAQATFPTILSTIGAVPLAGGTMTGYLVLNADPLTDFQAATKHYVDSVAAGISVQGACRVATTAALTVTYNNGSSGVGATITNAGTQAFLALDGVTLSLGDRFLVKDQAAPAQNGIYVATDLGSLVTNWVGTRAADYNSSVEIAAGDLVPVNQGATNGATSWLETATVVNVGTDAINFTQFSLSPAVLASAIQKNSYIAATDTGAANAYVAAISPTPAAYTQNMGFIVKIANANTTASTMNLNGLGLKNIKLTNGSDPAANDLLAGMYAWFLYDGTNVQLINPAGYLKPANNLSDVVSLPIANRNLVSLNVINAVTNIGGANFGQKIVCQGASPYTLSIVDHVGVNKWIDIYVQTTSNAIVTLAAVSGNFNGQATILLGSGDAIRVFDDGTNYWVVAINLQPANFLAYRSTNQAIVTATTSVVVFDTKVFDIGTFFNTSTGKYTPLLPGKYEFFTSMDFSVLNPATFVQVGVRKSGSSTLVGESTMMVTGSPSTMSGYAAYMASMNGSTDYIEGICVHNAGANRNCIGSQPDTYIYGKRVSLF